MKWYQIPLNTEQLAKGQGQRLKDEFKEIYDEEEAPEEMALFSGAGDEGGRVYYLSPGAVKYALIILTYYSGDRCEAPSADAVELELGSEDAKTRLFPKTS